MSTKPLFEPLQVGPCTLAHRVVMAPLTRMRATVPGHVANELNAQYYDQRASAGGLIIAEASQVMPGGGAGSTPGIHTPEQIEGCLLYTSPSPRDRTRSRMPSSA